MRVCADAATAAQVLAQEISGTAALSLESEEFKLKKRKLDKDARVLAQVNALVTYHLSLIACSRRSTRL